MGDGDLQNVLLGLKKHLTPPNLDDLNFYFKREAPPNESATSLFRYLMRENIINDRNVSKLIDALKTVHLEGLIGDLVKYEEKIANIPASCSRNDIFVGRREEIGNMQHYLDDIRRYGGHGFRAIFVTGLPGVGKTYLAEEFQRRETDTRVFEPMFISCRGLKTALGVRNLIMQNFGISIERDKLFKILEKSLESHGNTMLILDNLEEVMEQDGAKFDELIMHLCEAGNRVRNRSHCLLMTSRRRISPEVEVKLQDILLSISLENMNECDSLDLLDQYLGPRKLSEEDKKKLMTLCGQHTLSMALVASRLKRSEIPFDIIADEMQRAPLIQLKKIEDLGILNTQCCVEKSLLNTFISMDPEAQDLLVRLSIAADSIKESMARNLYRNTTSNARNAYSESLMQLLELNFVRFRKRSIAEEGSRRFFIHLLIRTFVTTYCEHPDCPEKLKETYAEAQEMLRLEYLSEMKRLNDSEWQDPLGYNRAIEMERHNFLPQLPGILDGMVTENASLNEFDQIFEISNHLLNSPKERSNMIQERKKVAQRNGAPAWVVAFFELRLADQVRMTGNHDRARESFEHVQDALKNRRGNMTPEQHDWLDAQYHRYYGRFLKDQSRGDYKRALKKAVDYLKRARDKFNNEALFHRVDRYLADINSDLGNAYKVYGDNDMCERRYLYTEARKAFDAARIIYEKANAQMVPLFHTYLSLAACDMELKSLLRSVDGREDRVSLSPAIAFYQKALDVAKANPNVIEKNDEMMGYMYYSRAVCNVRARNYLDAHGDIQEALRRRLNALGCHNATMNCYILLSDIYSRDDRNFTRHNKRALDCAEKGLRIAERLALKGADVNSVDLERLLNLFIMLCSRLDQDYGKYEKLIKAVEKRDMARLMSDIRANDTGSDDDMKFFEELNKSTLSTGNGQSEYRNSSSESGSDEETGSAPRCSEARDLSRKLKELMDKLAERLEYLSHVMDVVDMEILVAVLRDGYPNMKPDVRNNRYEKGLKLYSHLIRLKENPASVMKENRSKRKKR